MPKLEEIAEHNARKIERMFHANEITLNGAASLLGAICDLDEQAAAKVIAAWCNPRNKANGYVFK